MSPESRGGASSQPTPHPADASRALQQQTSSRSSSRRSSTCRASGASSCELQFNATRSLRGSAAASVHIFDGFVCHRTQTNHHAHRLGLPLASIDAPPSTNVGTMLRTAYSCFETSVNTADRQSSVRHPRMHAGRRRPWSQRRWVMRQVRCSSHQSTPRWTDIWVCRNSCLKQTRTQTTYELALSPGFLITPRGPW